MLRIKLQAEIAPIPTQPSNIYIELVVEKNGKLRKIEQWNFISLESLLASEYAQSVDSELDSVELKERSFEEALQEKLQQFSPKLLIKIIEPTNICIKLKTSEKSLTPFIEESNYLIEVYDYEGPDYTSRISMKTIHNDLPRSVRVSDLMSSDDDFEELVDEDFEREIRSKEKKGEKTEEKKEVPK